MTANPCPDEARAAFEEALLCAITEGRMPSRTFEFGAQTWAAIEAIAHEHPEAAVRLIADAYDTFEREYGEVA